ncbi:MOSC domain-containing protein [Streptomyces sp. NBC_01304]|uniref:MOSC domain-containing protein n=1 Tax=Streptomyces sp. NBC_01304 TaxID=2903818 RepID=UPI002E14B0C1|nr:MOSC N-terminal beta barrel domain-containing protein [Streptomyces sp. NBC_01304]
MASVVDLITYPVKGCAGVRVSQAQLTPAGLPHDRSFMVTDTGGVFRSQRRDPRLALIRPEPSPDGERLTLRAPGQEPLEVAVDLESARGDVELFGEPFRAIDQGAAVARWLSDFLGKDSRLVRVPPEHDRIADGLTPGTSGWADSSPLHMISLASLDELNRRITEAGRDPLPMSRFRPNIVVDGWSEPHREDLARHIEVGDTALAFAKLAVRCAVTLVDQDTGAKPGPEPLRTLATYRRGPDKGVIFGSKFSVLRTGKLGLGDELGVTAWESHTGTGS